MKRIEHRGLLPGLSLSRLIMNNYYSAYVHSIRNYHNINFSTELTLSNRINYYWVLWRGRQRQTMNALDQNNCDTT